MGEWGTTYHYTIAINNTGSKDRVVNMEFSQSENLIVGMRTDSEMPYTTKFYEKPGEEVSDPEQESKCSVTLPANKVTTFEVVTMLTGGAGGTHNSLVIE